MIIYKFQELLIKCLVAYIFFGTENWPLLPNSPYSASIAGGELLARSYHRTPGMDVVITRRGIPTYIFDNDFPTSDGTCICDYIHVSDNVIAIPERALRLRTYTMGKCTILNLETKKGFVRA